MQVLAPASGMDMGGTAGAPKVWISPERDIAHVFPDWVGRAFSLIEVTPDSPSMKWFSEQGGTEEDLCKLATMIASFVKLVAATTKDKMSVADALTQCGYKELSLPSRLVFGNALLNVLLSSYCYGYREAVRGPGDFPDRTLQLVVRHTESPSKAKRVYRKFLMWLYNLSV